MGRLIPAFLTVASLVFPMLDPAIVYADDTSTGVMLPELRSKPAGSVTVKAASLVLRGDNIEMTLTVAVQQNQPGSVTIKMPRFGWLGDAEPYPDRQFPELQLLDGSAPAKMESTFAAFVGSIDVTEAIRAAGVDPCVIADTPPFVSPKTDDAKALENLERLGAVEKSAEGYLAKWTAQRKVRVVLNPTSDTLTLRYKARPGYALRPYGQISSPAYLAQYCLSAHDLLTVFGHQVVTGWFVASDYAVPASVDDRALPSLSVDVDVPTKKEAQQSLIAFCGVDGRSVITKGATIKALARTDTKGIVRIISIGTSGTSERKAQ